MDTSPTPAAWSLVIHGGAGVMTRDGVPADQDVAARAGLGAALAAGAEILQSGGSALDAVEAAVRVLEDDSHFNAGRGAVFTAEGETSLDAAVMTGHDRRAGAVAGLSASRNPVSVARAVMEATPHVMLAGTGADEFARDYGAEQVSRDWFHTDERWQQLVDMRARGGGQAVFDANLKYGTVGAVARDTAGNLAAATSTGGLTGKRWGRIGDTPVIGAGTYADNRAGAVSATGSGEYFIRETVAAEICARARLLGQTLQIAGNDVVLTELKALGGDGGVILVDVHGVPGWSFNTPGMYRGRVTADSAPMTAIYEDEP
jgi:beta-aspartyl-peptidase (threonine type)